VSLVTGQELVAVYECCGHLIDLGADALVVGIGPSVVFQILDPRQRVALGKPHHAGVDFVPLGAPDVDPLGAHGSLMGFTPIKAPVVAAMIADVVKWWAVDHAFGVVKVDDTQCVLFSAR
jgi:hypothetical protein